MASKTVHPVETLREHAKALEAAIAVALANPGKPAVHGVRTLVRRLEAQMELLQELAALPADSAEAEELRRRLRKLRRAAGVVRDLDVQRKTLKTHPSLPKRAAAELREELKEEREEKAEKLQRVLLKQLPRVAGALEQLLQSVGTANGLVLPDLRLVPLVERWSRSREESGPPEGLDDEQLHTRRKVAKSARYMVESAKGSPAAQRAAARYEEEQEAGGHWHDWVDLEATSREYFGGKHPLTQAAAAQGKVARAKYVKLLRGSGG
jgi:CHAD domain-containing protein